MPASAQPPAIGGIGLIAVVGKPPAEEMRYVLILECVAFHDGHEKGAAKSRQRFIRSGGRDGLLGHGSILVNHYFEH